MDGFSQLRRDRDRCHQPFRLRTKPAASGRFDRQVVVGLPDIVAAADLEIMRMRKVHSTDVKADILARGALVFAPIANLVNEAALLHSRAKRLVECGFGCEG